MNFKHILSKSSLRSSTSSGKSLVPTEVNKKIEDEFESLKLNVLSLKVLLESRDAAIGTLAREKEKLYVELKSAQRLSRIIQQQLFEEREMHSREKELFVDNMKRITAKITNGGKFLEEETYVQALKNEIACKDEVIYNICSKYLKLKKSKEELNTSYISLQQITQQTFKNVVTTLEDNKNSLYILLEELKKGAKSSPAHNKYLKLLKMNADLNFENSQLKLLLISKNDYKYNDDNEKNQSETSAVTAFQYACSNDKVENVSKIMKHRTPTYCIREFRRRNKIKASKIFGVSSNPKNINLINKYGRKICYRSMSDTALSNKLYN